MKKNDLNYEKIHKALNLFDLKVPKSKKFTQLLKLLYSPEEAEVIAHFGLPYFYAEVPEVTAEKTGKSKEEVETLFAGMVGRGTLFSQKSPKGETEYTLPPFIPGIYEFYTMSRNDPAEKKKEILKILDDYFFETFVPDAFNASEYPWFRVLPAEISVKRLIAVNDDVEPESRVLPFETASEYISSAKYIAVGPCACRDHAAIQDGKRRCDKPMDVCLVFDKVAEYWAEKKIGRLISHEEAVEVLNISAKAGLVHCTTNNQTFGEHMSGMICNCCPCCCFILQGVLKTRGQQGLAQSNFSPVIDKNNCNLCKKCIKECPVDALYHHKPHLDDQSDNFVALNEKECLGCGVCTNVCSENAMTMKKVRNDIPEVDVLHLGNRHSIMKKH